jgi:hypothetical protein
MKVDGGGQGSGVGEGSSGWCWFGSAIVVVAGAAARGAVVMPLPVAVGLRQPRVVWLPRPGGRRTHTRPLARPAMDMHLRAGAAPPSMTTSTARRYSGIRWAVQMPTRRATCTPQNGGANLTATWAPEFRPKRASDALPPMRSLCVGATVNRTARETGVSKTVSGLWVRRAFESLPLRLLVIAGARPCGSGCSPRPRCRGCRPARSRRRQGC